MKITYVSVGPVGHGARVGRLEFVAEDHGDDCRMIDAMAKAANALARVEISITERDPIQSHPAPGTGSESDAAKRGGSGSDLASLRVGDMLEHYGTKWMAVGWRVDRGRLGVYILATMPAATPVTWWYEGGDYGVDVHVGPDETTAAVRPRMCER